MLSTSGNIPFSFGGPSPGHVLPTTPTTSVFSFGVLFKPWELPKDFHAHAIYKARERARNFIEQMNKYPWLDFSEGPDPCPGHDYPVPGENGWAPDINGRWFGPNEYFNANWKQLIGQASPRIPSPQKIFKVSENTILDRAFRMGFIPDSVSGWKQIKDVLPALPVPMFPRPKNTAIKTPIRAESPPYAW